ncbi:U8 snoRNA-decapping enzyme-like isoform X2 [Stegodyphus dumicola]|uniref:U8 snoRNA-decapping enzyme-like isoform X2 n=1 Tax=Stegodyphus dumicola TaxID=202533 RepID=UPI0015ACF8ED|nr:U8 snoRNA-decapping enzyme-like isoform X2 [Stegodyphus dumicola]
MVTIKILCYHFALHKFFEHFTAELLIATVIPASVLIIIISDITSKEHGYVCELSNLLLQCIVVISTNLLELACKYVSDAKFASTFNEEVNPGFLQMQLRFDGCIGFPGGIIEEGTNIVKGLNRELEEEINLNSKYFVTDENHLFSHVNIEAKTCFHFYGKEVSKEEFQHIEKNALDARDYGIETFGMIRVPLFTMQDGIRGFPTFLKNCFIDLLHCLFDYKLQFRRFSLPEEMK